MNNSNHDLMDFLGKMLVYCLVWLLGTAIIIPVSQTLPFLATLIIALAVFVAPFYLTAWMWKRKETTLLKASNPSQSTPNNNMVPAKSTPVRTVLRKDDSIQKPILTESSKNTKASTTGSGGCIGGVIVLAVIGILLIPELDGLIKLVALVLVIGFAASTYNWFK